LSEEIDYLTIKNLLADLGSFSNPPLEKGRCGGVVKKIFNSFVVLNKKWIKMDIIKYKTTPCTPFVKGECTYSTVSSDTYG
jgi:hypothetical protein